MTNQTQIIAATDEQIPFADLYLSDINPRTIVNDDAIAVERQPSWPVPTTTLAGGAGRKTGLPVWRAAPPA
jgi:hypothetical protein